MDVIAEWHINGKWRCKHSLDYESEVVPKITGTSFYARTKLIFVWMSLRFVWCNMRKEIQKCITSLCKGQEVMMKSHGRENHSEWFANDCYKKCISVEEVLQED